MFSRCLTTTPTLKGEKFVKYCGVTAGETVLGATSSRTSSQASGTSSVAGWLPMKELQRAGEIALAELQERAASRASPS